MGYFSFIVASTSHVNSGPLRASHLTLTIDTCFLRSFFTCRSSIDKGFSTNFKLSSICTSVCGITNDSSAKHFFRLQMWNTL
ncbi:hypothetical protein HanPSC8_Chr13g0556481 [Helianthus annuus]|nr:hypothetical protein HanPSC8_Chr13g0556481 [Helianthus annuus]